MLNKYRLKTYKLNFAPNYVLIDHNGNLVSARAERPDKISEEIDKLIEKMNKNENEL